MTVTQDLNQFYEGFPPIELRRMVISAISHGDAEFVQTMEHVSCLKSIVKDLQFYISKIGHVHALAYYLNAHPKDRDGFASMLSIFDNTDPQGQATRVAMVTRNTHACEMIKEKLVITQEHAECLWEAVDLNNFDMMAHFVSALDSRAAATAIQQILSKETREVGNKSQPMTIEDVSKRSRLGMERVLDACRNHQEVAQMVGNTYQFQVRSIFSDFYPKWLSMRSKQDLQAHVEPGMGQSNKISKM